MPGSRSPTSSGGRASTTGCTRWPAMAGAGIPRMPAGWSTRRARSRGSVVRPTRARRWVWRWPVSRAMSRPARSGERLDAQLRPWSTQFTQTFDWFDDDRATWQESALDHRPPDADWHRAGPHQLRGTFRLLRHAVRNRSVSAHPARDLRLCELRRQRRSRALPAQPRRARTVSIASAAASKPRPDGGGSTSPPPPTSTSAPSPSTPASGCSPAGRSTCPAS